MASNRFSIILLFFFSIVLPLQALSQSKTERIIISLNKVIKPIKIINADSSFEDLDFLKEILKDKEIIALGEATHGTREIFDYKDRLVRFLVTNLEYKAVAFESDFIAVEKINDYINGKILRLGNLSGTPLHLDNIKMIEWLRKYNLTQSVENRIHVYGLEARGFNNISAKILENFSDLSAYDKQILQKLQATRYTDIKKEDINLIKVTVENLRKTEHNPLLHHYINLLEQNIDVFYEKKIGVRDEYLAKNVTWIKENCRNNKLIVWAHNGHVAKTNLYNKPSMGTFLFDQYKSKYFVIATDFNHGEVRVRKYIAKNKPVENFAPLYYSEVNSENAYEYYFKQCKFKNFIINVDEASKNKELNDFFSQPKELRMIGALSTPVNKKLSIAENFDLVVFINESTAQ